MTLTESEKIDQMEARLRKVEAAFPAGDPEGHRRYHETQIELLEEKRRLRIAIQEKTISALLWSGIVGTIMWLWNNFILWIHQINANHP